MNSQSKTTRLFRYIMSKLKIHYAVGNTILVTEGLTKLTVDTVFTPKNVWLNSPTSIETLPNGFLLTTNLNNGFRSFEWVAKG